ncbi:MAG: nicotinate (nicotinamide) nucleotide adenylyltransferase [Dorea sp.]|nr:nicotinate (nicotinamide) nucleotide adenylyltransferase [Dorea sp.]
MNIGIMGGTFDPVHNGHLAIAEAAYEQFGLDRVWFLPNGNPPHKALADIGSSIEDRLKMVQLAIAGRTGFKLEPYEARRKSVSCSYETMEHFSKIYPEHDFYFIIGADSLFTVDKWVHPERLFPTCTILAAFRDEMDTREKMDRQMHYLKEKYHAKSALLLSPIVQISSSEIRERIRDGKSINGFVPDNVEEYIKKECLYESQDQ